MEFISSVQIPLAAEGKSYWFFLQSNRVLVASENRQSPIPCVADPGELAIEVMCTQFLGTLDGVCCFAAELPPAMPWPDGMTFMNLRELFGLLDEPMYKAAVYAQQIMAWDRDHQFCGGCGTRTEPVSGERSKKCPRCGLVYFSRISPAVMVAIIKDNKILLAKNGTFPAGFYSVLAGFVEPAEKLEEAIVREVREEVGLEIANIRYFDSQPWPFPNSLMIAFTAEYAGGDIVVDGGEIVEADWYAADNLPRCPTGNLSVAGKLIDWYRKEFSGL